MKKRNKSPYQYVLSKYEQYLKISGGGLPKMFNPYNLCEITDLAPTQTCHCGNWTSSATVLILEEIKDETNKK